MVDRHRHRLNGDEGEAAVRFDEYLTNRTGASTGAHPAALRGQGARLSRM
jgi:hypothetical protein